MIKLSDVVKAESKSSVSRFLAISKAWRTATTENIANVTTPVKLDGDKIFILVHDNIWLTELRYMKQSIIERLANVGVVVKDIDFRYSPIYIKSDKKKQELLAVTEIEKIYIEKLSSNLDNERLRSAYKSALSAYFRRYTFDEFMDR